MPGFLQLKFDKFFSLLGKWKLEIIKSGYKSIGKKDRNLDVISKYSSYEIISRETED